MTPAMDPGADVDTPATDPAEADSGAPADTQANYQICIRVEDHVPTSVCREPLEDKQQEAAEGGSEYQEIPVDGVEGALKATMRIIREQSAGSDQAQMNEGYQQASAKETY